MVAGVMVAAAIPIAAGAVGYAIIKGIKYFFTEHNLSREGFDAVWERPKELSD